MRLFRRKSSQDPEEQPSFWRDYLLAFKPGFDPKCPIQEAGFVVFDTETTGLDPSRDQLLAIGAIPVRNWRIQVADAFECTITPNQNAAGASIPIHGILPKIHPDNLPETEAVKQFIRLAGNQILVGHHIGFDVAMINKSLQPLTGGKLKNKMLDTGHLARRVNPVSGPLYPSSPADLDELCRQYHIRPSDRHTAAGDAMITATLFLKLLARLRNRGVHTIGDLLRQR